MVRTQIQLTEKQASDLKRIAAIEHVSVAELIRRAVDGIASSREAADPGERKRAALAVAGKFHSGCGDISRNHDKYLAEDFGK